MTEKDDPFPPLTPGVADVAVREITNISARAYSRAAIHYAQNSETLVKYSKGDRQSQLVAHAAIAQQFDKTDECKQLEVAFSNLEGLVMSRADPAFDDAAKKTWQDTLAGWDNYMQEQVSKGDLPDSVLADYKEANAIATIETPLQTWVDIARRRERNYGIAAS